MAVNINPSNVRVPRQGPHTGGGGWIVNIIGLAEVSAVLENLRTATEYAGRGETTIGSTKPYAYGQEFSAGRGGRRARVDPTWRENPRASAAERQLDYNPPARYIQRAMAEVFPGADSRLGFALQAGRDSYRLALDGLAREVVEQAKVLAPHGFTGELSKSLEWNTYLSSGGNTSKR